MTIESPSNEGDFFYAQGGDMNVGEAVAYLWELAGEPSDLDPWGVNETLYDPSVPGALITTSFGYRYFIKQINKAQNTLANMRTRRGRPIRFNKFITRKNVRLGLTDPTSATVEILTDDTIRVTDVPSTNLNDYIDTKINLIRSSLDIPQAISDAGLNKGAWLVGTTYAVQEVVSYDGFLYQSNADDNTGNIPSTSSTSWTFFSSTDEQTFLVVQAEIVSAGTIDFTLLTDIEDTTFTAETLMAEFYFNAFRIAKNSTTSNGYTINLPTYARNILAITNMATGGKLTRAEAKTKLYDYLMLEGTPVQWYKSGEVIYFDAYLAEPIWWIFDYQRLPIDVLAYDDEFDVPEQWQDVILMLVELDTARRMLENERATVLQSQVNTLIGQLRTEEEDDWLGEETQGFYIRKEAR